MGQTINNSDIPPFSEPYLSRQINVATTTDTQVMRVPYNLGDKTARFFPTRVVIRNKDASTAVTVSFWDSDLTAPAGTITAGANGAAATPLFGVNLLGASTEKIIEFTPGISTLWLHLGLAVKLGGAQSVDILLEGYMQY